MPSLPALPLWLWRRAGRRLRVVVVVLAAAAALGLAGFLLHAPGVREHARRDAATSRERAAQRLRADQAPRHGRAGRASELQPALEHAIDRDVGARLPRFGAAVTSCRRITPVDSAGSPLPLPASDAYFKCFAVRKTRETVAATLQLGYGFRARADLRTLAFAWCKLNPRPIHPDQEEFLSVPLSDECAPPQAAD